MVAVIDNVFSIEDVEYLVEASQATKIAELGKTSFTVPMTDSIRNALLSKCGLEIDAAMELPMTWVVGDSEPHVDSCDAEFETTFLVYLQDGLGEFIVGDDSYPMVANSGFSFPEGVMHLTRGCEMEPRLMVGPMNELGVKVGEVSVGLMRAQDYTPYPGSWAGGKRKSKSKRRIGGKKKNKTLRRKMTGGQSPDSATCSIM